MFDKTILQPTHTEFIPYEKTVTINRAPTDESIKLLNEMSEKVINNIIGTYKLENCPIDNIAILVLAPIDMNHRLVIKFKINGKEHIVKVVIEPQYLMDKSTMINKICEEIKNAMNHEIMMTILKDAKVNELNNLYRRI
ncbi:MAG: hypothetical protein ACM34K_13235 [Bacillota bacterium]